MTLSFLFFPFFPSKSIGSSTFSQAVAYGRRLKFWKTKPSFLLRAAASWSNVSPATLSPSSRYSPAVGVSRQPMMFIRVDFPDPDGPMMETNSPFPIVRDIPRSASSVWLPV